MKLLIKPRLQKDKWSVYWKTSMATRTLTLDSFELDVDPAVVTGKQLRATVAAAIGLQPEKTLCRLEGFVEPWELACVPWHRVPTHTPFPAYRSVASLARSPQQHARATTLRRPDENATFQLPLAETTQEVVSTRPLPMLSKIRNTDPLTAIFHAISSRHRSRHVTPLSMHKGRELDDDKTLKDLGVEEEGSTIVTVRKVLVAEGWKIIQEDDEDSDTEEDDF
jgi:hypothetical protein